MTITQMIDAVTAPIIQRVAPGRPRLKQVVDAITSETGVRHSEARAFVMSIRGGISETLSEGETRWFPSDAWLARYHSILEAIAPDDVRSFDGSAHSLIERFVLDPTKGQLGLVHGKHERTWRQDGNLHCTIDICVDVVPVP